MRGALREADLRDFGGGQGIGELAEAEIDFFEGFGAGGEEALESDAKIGFETSRFQRRASLGSTDRGGDGVAP